MHILWMINVEIWTQACLITFSNSFSCEDFQSLYCSACSFILCCSWTCIFNYINQMPVYFSLEELRYYNCQDKLTFWPFRNCISFCNCFTTSSLFSLRFRSKISFSCFLWNFKSRRAWKMKIGVYLERIMYNHLFGENVLVHICHLL